MTDELRRAVAGAICLQRLTVAWGVDRGSQKMAAMGWPKTEKEWRAYRHNPVAEIDLAMACADAAIAVIRDALQDLPPLTRKDFSDWHFYAEDLPEASKGIGWAPERIAVMVAFANYTRGAMLAASPLGDGE